ncbi:MAG: FKBP-type peptidyl-prolyl cis-trans isomerase SlyD [Verrucomicrobiales bacterium]|jgi:FKBP-type peptidyl-prolyl cis-trans isomerase SlyD
MIKNDQVVSIHYKLTNDAGEVIDSSEGRDPLKYLQGHGNIVPGLEKEMTGKAVGDKFDVVVPPEEGYGVRDDTKIGKVPRAQVEVEDLEIGTKLQAETPEGVSILTVLEVSDEEITLDANHELAGMTLNFVIEVAEVRDAEQVEIDHGHVH